MDRDPGSDQEALRSLADFSRHPGSSTAVAPIVTSYLGADPADAYDRKLSTLGDFG